MYKATSLNDSSAKNYYVEIRQTIFSENYQSKEIEILDGINGNHKECNDFLSKLNLTHSKYDFKQQKTFEYIGEKYFHGKSREKIHIVLSYKQAETQIKDLSHCVISFCTTSRAVFRLITESTLSTNEVSKKIRLSKSDVSNIKAGLRHFGFDDALRIAYNLDKINEFSEIINTEIANAIETAKEKKINEDFATLKALSQEKGRYS